MLFWNQGMDGCSEAPLLTNMVITQFGGKGEEGVHRI